MQRRHTVGQSVNTLKENNSMADPYSHSQKPALTTNLRHNEWVSSYAGLWAHSGERQQQEDDDCLWKTIFPIANFMGHTLYLQSWYEWKNFLCALIDCSVPTSLVHSSSIHSWKVPRTCKASWDFLQRSRGTQSLTEFGVQKTTTDREVLHRQMVLII